MMICRNCGCTPEQALADARVVGFQDEFKAGVYRCCQVVTWADEQWLAWADAATEDGKCEEEATKTLEWLELPSAAPVRVRVQPKSE